MMMGMFTLSVIAWLTYLAVFGFEAGVPPREISDVPSQEITTTTSSSTTTSPTLLAPISEAAPPFLSPTSLQPSTFLRGEAPRSTVPEVSRAQRSRSAVVPASTTTLLSPTDSETPTTEAPSPETESPEAPPEPTSTVPSTVPEQTDWQRSEASWYGPGLYGNSTACGQTYTADLPGVAHRTLRCGTLVTFRHGGKEVTVPVIDRGPYVSGRTWDLSARTCRDLGHCYTGAIEWRLA